jgi:sulfate permease, SulP family
VPTRPERSRRNRSTAGWVLPSLRGYRRSWIAADALAGLSLLVIAVPSQLATARLAGMPPITGFYAFVAGTVAFALLGSNPQMSVGADSTIAPLFAIGISHLAPIGSGGYVDLVGILAVTVGVIVALVGLLRLGWVAELLSAPIVLGFMAGVAVTIVVHELPAFLGLAAGTGSTLHRIVLIGRSLDRVNGWALGIGAGVLAVVVGASVLGRKLPGALIGLVGSTAVVAAFGLRSRGVEVLGTVPHGAPRWGLVGLSWSTLGSVLPLAAGVALVVISQTAATTRAAADQGGFPVDVNRDFLGVGVGSIAAGVVGAFPVDASPPSTVAVGVAGGRSQLGLLGAAGAIVLLVPAAGLLEDVPLATLAAVLFFVAARIVNARDLVDVARFDVLELGLTVVTLLVVALVGVEQGIVVAVLLAVADRTRRSARPHLHVLGRIPGTTSWAPLSGSEREAQVPGVLAVLFAAPLWYANAEHFRVELRQARRRTIGTTRLVVLDAIGTSDIDYTGIRVLREVLDELHRSGIQLAVARAGDRVYRALSRGGLVERIGADHLFSSVDEAVVALAEASTTS